MPETKTIKEGLSFGSIAERLGATKTLVLPITRGWSVKFEATQNDPEGVWVDFYYNGNMGRDGNATMSIHCNIHTIDQLYEEAKSQAQAELATDNTKYKGCFGVAVYRNLLDLRNKETSK